MKKGLIVAVIVCLAAACATAPVARTIVNSFPIDQPFDKVWQSVIETFAELNLPIMNMAKDSGLITTDWIRFSGYAARYADCGGLGANQEIERRGRFNVYVKKTSAAACEMKVNSVFEHTITSALVSGPATTSSCVSTGKLEEEIYKKVTEKIK